MKNFILKQLVKSKMKNLPQDQQEKILKILEKNPEFFIKISKEIKEKMDSGKDQQSATMEVAEKYKAEIGQMMNEK